MTAPRRLMVIVLTLVVSSSLAGCNVRDWWDLQGTFHVDIGPQPSANSALKDFQKLTIAVYEVSLKQQGELNAHFFAFAEEPRLIDMVELGENGQTARVVSTTRIIRPMEAVQVRIAIVEAIDAQGRSLPACFPNEPVESRPCVSTPRNGAYRLDDVPFSPPRGGSVTYIFPLAVQYSASTNEYFIQSDPSLIKLESKR